MNKTLEEKALEAYPEDWYRDCDGDSWDANEKLRKGYIKGYDQAVQDFLEKACVNFCKQCSWRCKYEVTKEEYCKNLLDFKQALMQE